MTLASGPNVHSSTDLITFKKFNIKIRASLLLIYRRDRDIVFWSSKQVDKTFSIE